MTPITKNKPAHKQKLLKMHELSRLTGVPPGTIRYYINEGLLPRPLKTHRNMAYYDQSYVQRIRLIRELQEKRYFPLSIIKQILEQGESSMDTQEIKTILELEGRLFKNISTLPKFDPPDLKALCELTGVSKEEVLEMERVGIIWRKLDGRFDEDSVRIIEILRKLRDAGYTEEAGFNSEFIKIYVDLIEVLARQEVRFFSKTVTGRMSPDEMVNMAENGINLLNTLIGLLRKRMILKIGRELDPQRQL
ncbi:MAG: MerR family transcriptional regulator [Candidatus Abyssobacteria bacterium SURF_5]|uniref:MerR family transcriptional regulator n=1 Tax=Abyssobacteria bacterium (strain SURF_5) TaxID=2093360 RepID=A0A3A4P868_ABYX5|nr:MAG: MerR family transcriptional regulator [Candidatus Abyssubacteria bacterium SURF_5]